MAYRYNYGALMSANATNNNFKPLSEVAGTADHTNMATALLEAKGLTVGTAETDAVLASLPTVTNDSQVTGFQDIAGLSESDTAVARGDTWGGSDATMGKSWLEGIVSGATDATNIGIEDLYQQGFGRASDAGGLAHWTGDMERGSTIQDIAKHFLASEESNIRDVYHDAYGRDADQSGLDYWMGHTGEADYKGDGTDAENDFNAATMLRRIVGDSSTVETNVRQRLSDELGLHSSDAQRLADTTLHGVDNIAGTADDIFTDASEADVFRMMASDDLGASEIADKVTMQRAAQHMGDFGGGDQDVGATKIHRMLANQEMGTAVISNNINDGTFGQEQWVSNQDTLAKTAADYLPQVTTNADGTTSTTNQWSLLKAETQDYDEDDPVDPCLLYTSDAADE